VTRGLIVGEEFEHPKLRPVEVVQAVLDGQPAAALIDPLRIADAPLAISKEVAFLLQFMDGRHSLRDIQVEYTRRMGTLLFTDQLERLLAKLDHAYFLDSPRFHERRRELQEEFSRSAVRAPTLAGTAYPADAEPLRRQLGSYFAEARASAEVRAPTDSRSSPDRRVDNVDARTRPRPKGILAPHIDLSHGGTTYARAYAELAGHEPPALCVILGTGHFGVENLFTATKKAFQTPLGTAQADSAFVEELDTRWERDLFADEFVHRTEHSIELQVLFIQHLWSGLQCPLIAPILCAFSHTSANSTAEQSEAAAINEFADALKSAAEAQGKTVLFIASADLAHIGPRYGDPQPPDLADLGHIRERDREFLTIAERLDRHGCLAHIARDDNRRRICGFAPIYTMLGAMNASRGELLGYAKADVDGAGSWVTFASMLFR